MNNQKQIEQLKNIVSILSSKGNYDANEYMLGMANGLILALSIMTKEKPEFLDPPEIWSKPNTFE